MSNFNFHRDFSYKAPNKKIHKGLDVIEFDRDEEATISYYEVLYYVGETADEAVQGDYLTEEFKDKSKALEFYNSMKDDSDKHMFWVTSRTRDGELVEEFHLDADRPKATDEELIEDSLPVTEMSVELLPLVNDVNAVFDKFLNYVVAGSPAGIEFFYDANIYSLVVRGMTEESYAMFKRLNMPYLERHIIDQINAEGVNIEEARRILGDSLNVKFLKATEVKAGDEKKEPKKCVICKGDIKGHGHNAAPVKKGEACDKCNIDKVLPARLKAKDSNAGSALDSWLQDVAQITGEITYSDIKNVNQDNIKEIKKLRREWRELLKEDPEAEDELFDIGKRVKKVLATKAKDEKNVDDLKKLVKELDAKIKVAVKDNDEKEYVKLSNERNNIMREIMKINNAKAKEAKK